MCTTSQHTYYSPSANHQLSTHLCPSSVCVKAPEAMSAITRPRCLSPTAMRAWLEAQADMATASTLSEQLKLQATCVLGLAVGWGRECGCTGYNAQGRGEETHKRWEGKCQTHGSAWGVSCRLNSCIAQAAQTAPLVAEALFFFCLPL